MATLVAVRQARGDGAAKVMGGWPPVVAGGSWCAAGRVWAGAEIIGYNGCMATMNALRNVPGDWLTARMQTIRRQERELLVEFLACLGELTRRQLHLELGFGSVFVFLRDHLGYDPASAFRRDEAAKLMARFPVIAEYLADGRLGLVTLVLLRDVLEEIRLEEILGRAAGRNKDEVKRLVAALAPRPAPPEMIRRLPVRSEPAPVEPPPAISFTVQQAPAPVSFTVKQELPSTVEPINATQHVVRFAVDDAFLADLAAVKAMLSHVIPAGGLADVLHHCVRRTLEVGQKRGTGTPRAAKVSRRPPAAMEAEVRRRDGESCAYVAPDGRRCGSTYQLEVHHVHAVGKQGPTTVDNLSLRCRAHNRYHAEQDFGVQHVARAIAERQQGLF